MYHPFMEIVQKGYVFDGQFFGVSLG